VSLRHLLSSTFSILFNHTAPPETYTLSLHDALPISGNRPASRRPGRPAGARAGRAGGGAPPRAGGRRGRGGEVTSWAFGEVRGRSEEHTSELQSRENLVCRLLLEKKKRKNKESMREW